MVPAIMETLFSVFNFFSPLLAMVMLNPIIYKIRYLLLTLIFWNKRDLNATANSSSLSKTNTIGKRRVLKKQRSRKTRKNKQLLGKELKASLFRDWASGLPDHLLELVIERLSLFDCLSFGIVCKPWSKLCERSSCRIPLLVKHGRDEDITRTCLNVLDKKKSSFQIKLPEACRGSCIWGSFQDWLFLARHVGAVLHISLFNPFSGDDIKLPDVYGKYNKMVISSVPTDPKCICMLVDLFNPVSIWTPGASRWRQISSLYGGYAFYYEDSFYLDQSTSEMVVINETSFHRILEINDDGACDLIPLCEMQTLQFAWPNPFKSSNYIGTYLLESCRDILLVGRFINKFKTSCCDTYRLDLSQMKWVELESLGDRILFLGKYSSRSFNAKELGDKALANYTKDHTCFMANELKLDCFIGKYDHWITAPFWWYLKERNFTMLKPGQDEVEGSLEHNSTLLSS